MMNYDDDCGGRKTKSSNMSKTMHHVMDGEDLSGGLEEMMRLDFGIFDFFDLKFQQSYESQSNRRKFEKFQST